MGNKLLQLFNECSLGKIHTHYDDELEDFIDFSLILPFRLFNVDFYTNFVKKKTDNDNTPYDHS